MLDFTKIKLIIWDLDETFWSGTISEQNVVISSENIELIKMLTDCGIVNSICSKNDFETVKERLEQADLWDYFVFPSIDWTSKGTRIKSTIENMALRPANVLFLDDNLLNINEAIHYCPDIMTAEPKELKALYEFAKNTEKKDTAHKRLKQYKILQKKVNEKDNFSDNTEFLRSCNIIVKMKEDCKNQESRLHELLLRSNQINFTKIRPTEDEFKNILNDQDIKCGYVEVSDKFGEYGIVGFYAMNADRLIHFAFSCRTLGMGVEQYVYAQLGFPQITIVPPVSSSLPKKDDKIPDWINSAKSQETENVDLVKGKILMKGPCDLIQIFSFIKNSETVEHEFSFIDDAGKVVAGHNHTASILTAMTAPKKRKQEILNEFGNVSKEYFETKLNDIKYDFVLLSMFLDVYSKIYQRKSTKECIAFSWEDTGNAAQDALYEQLNNDDGNITINNLQKIRDILPQKTVMILVLPPTYPFDKDKENYHLKCEVFVNKIKDWAKNKNNVELVEFSKYVTSSKDFTDGFFHYTKNVYYKVAMRVIEILNEKSSYNFESKSKLYLMGRILYNKLPEGIRKTLNNKLMFRGIVEKK